MQTLILRHDQNLQKGDKIKKPADKRRVKKFFFGSLLYYHILSKKSSLVIILEIWY